MYDSFLGHVTWHIRGLLYRPQFERDGWTVRFVDRQPGGARAEPAQIRRQEQQILEMAGDYDAVYLLKIASLRLVRRLRKQTDAKLVFDLTDALWKPVHRREGWQNLNAILRRVDAVFSEMLVWVLPGVRWSCWVFLAGLDALAVFLAGMFL